MKPRGWRRLTLRHDGRPFLERWGFDLGPVGVYVHHVAGPDPGLDLHDHPWPFVSVVLSGGYSEHVSEVRALHSTTYRSWPRWSVHSMSFGVAHRITSARPGTWTLVLRGPKSRPWGFFVDGRWVAWDEYDYATRRPGSADSSKADEVHDQAMA